MGCCLGMGRLLWFVCFASALFYVYACMYCLYVCLCRCLYVILCMLVYAGCEGAGSFAGGWSSLAYMYTYLHIFMTQGIPYLLHQKKRRLAYSHLKALQSPWTFKKVRFFFFEMG